MSYTRRYLKSFTVSGSVTGGDGKSVSYTREVQVAIDLTVDTRPFDASVHSLLGSIRVLAGSISATEAAQIASIRKNASDIAQTVTGGFFSAVQVGIEQQKTELEKDIESLILDLNEKQKRCLDKKNQMQTDYARLSERYAQLFDDLNSELSSRIHALDNPIFRLCDSTNHFIFRIMKNGLAGTVLVAGREKGRLQAGIGSSLLKKHASDLVARLGKFLNRQRACVQSIGDITVMENRSGCYYAPVCVVTTVGASGTGETSVHGSHLISSELLLKNIGRLQQAMNGKQVSATGMVSRFSDAEILRRYPGNDSRSTRIKNCIRRMIQGT